MPPASGLFPPITSAAIYFSTETIAIFWIELWRNSHYVPSKRDIHLFLIRPLPLVSLHYPDWKEQGLLSELTEALGGGHVRYNENLFSFPGGSESSRVSRISTAAALGE